MPSVRNVSAATASGKRSAVIKVPAALSAGQNSLPRPQIHAEGRAERRYGRSAHKKFGADNFSRRQPQVAVRLKAISAAFVAAACDAYLKATTMNEKRKTRTVAGQVLKADSFAFVGDSADVSTWKLPLLAPGNPAVTRNLVKNALHRFAETKGIPESERVGVWQLICGAAKCQGIQAQKQAPAPVKRESEKPAPFVVDAEGVDDLKEALAVADLAAARFLHTLGYGER